MVENGQRRDDQNACVYAIRNQCNKKVAAKNSNDLNMNYEEKKMHETNVRRSLD